MVGDFYGMVYFWMIWFVCWVFFRFTREFFLLEDVTIDDEELQILLGTHGSEGSLTCHTCCDTVQPEVIVIFEDTCVAERLAMNLSLNVVMIKVSPDRGSNPDLPHPAYVNMLCKRWNDMMWYGVFEKDKFGITEKYLTHYNAHIMMHKECYCR